MVNKLRLYIIFHTASLTFMSIRCLLPVRRRYEFFITMWLFLFFFHNMRFIRGKNNVLYYNIKWIVIWNRRELHNKLPRFFHPEVAQSKHKCIIPYLKKNVALMWYIMYECYWINNITLGRKEFLNKSVNLLLVIIIC